MVAASTRFRSGCGTRTGPAIPDIWDVPQCPPVQVAETLDAAGPDLASFIDTATARASSLLGLDICVLSSVDPASGLQTSCDVVGLPKDPARELRIFELEWFSDDPLRYHELAHSPIPAAALRLSADPTQVRRYVEIFEPNGGYDELRLSCIADGTWWATLSGYRAVGSGAFVQEEVDQAARLSKPLARGFRRAFLHAAVQQPGDLERPPGAFTIDREGHLVTTTGTAEAWLATVDQDRLSTLNGALAVAVDRDGAVTMTTNGKAGPLTFHATALKGEYDGYSVIIEYPRPIHLTPLIVAAYDLTPRERDVTELVLEGLVTKQIARRLGISAYTVQDHLKSIFAKTDTATRGELCAAVYLRFYTSPQRNGASPGPYGYFLFE